MRAITTRFMTGYKGNEVLEALESEYGIAQIIKSSIDFEEAVYSAGFINAINSGRIPESLDIYSNADYKKDKEYHHLIINDECFIMYF